MINKTIYLAVGMNREGYKEVIGIWLGELESTFPQAATQIYFVHQIRNGCLYVVWKDKKAFSADLKAIYNAPNKDAALHELERF